MAARLGNRLTARLVGGGFTLAWTLACGDSVVPMADPRPVTTRPEPAPVPVPTTEPEPDTIVGEPEGPLDLGRVWGGRQLVDILFVVDDSASSADKMRDYRRYISDALNFIVYPGCIERHDAHVPEDDELVLADRLGYCQNGLRRLVNPVGRLHVALLRSSLGAHGAALDESIDGACLVDGPLGHLVGSRQAVGTETEAESGVLTWESEASENHFGDATEFFENVDARLGELDSDGCSFEAPMEAAYRFLVEPAPYRSLVRVPCNERDTAGSCVQPDGIDEELLAQRAAFLRPKSTVVIVFISDENDCSVRDDGIGFWAMTDFPMRGTNACQTDPNAPCCHSCSVVPPAECPTVPEENGCAEAPVTADEDPAWPEAASRLRCHEQKRRLGIDLLYPVSRYVEGFGSPEITRSDGSRVPNPLYAGDRLANAVLVVSIVGTPWQDVVWDLDDPRGVVRRAALQPWERFFPEGSPEAFDPLNLETTSVRSGVHPVTGDVLGSTDDPPNPLNGFDRTFRAMDGHPDDLQHACLFELGAPHECDTAGESCPCREPTGVTDAGVPSEAPRDPSCLANDVWTVGPQGSAKAFPGTRFMELSRALGMQAVLGSLCVRNTDDPTAWTFGFRPPITSILSWAQPTVP